MFTYCAYQGCPNQNIPNSNLTFFRLPKDSRRQIWIRNSGSPELKMLNEKTTKIFCEKHFDPKYIRRQFTRTTLHRNAIPYKYHNDSVRNHFSYNFINETIDNQNKKQYPSNDDEDDDDDNNDDYENVITQSTSRYIIAVDVSSNNLDEVPSSSSTKKEYEVIIENFDEKSKKNYNEKSRRNYDEIILCDNGNREECESDVSKISAYSNTPNIKLQQNHKRKLSNEHIADKTRKQNKIQNVSLENENDEIENNDVSYEPNCENNMAELLNIDEKDVENDENNVVDVENSIEKTKSIVSKEDEDEEQIEEENIMKTVERIIENSEYSSNNQISVTSSNSQDDQKQSTSNDYEEDKHFALSLVGYFQRLSRQRKALAKLKILQYLTDLELKQCDDINSLK